MESKTNPGLSLEKLQKITRAIECSFLEERAITLYTYSEKLPHKGIIEQIDQHRQALRIGPSDWIPFSSITEAMIDNQNPGGEHG
ncbi:YolD-like family protein [Paenibacillus rubinfantis]|uniref:YolD-like family protein n=1 Tax=Paenibacillus rubinfantis TaxID=1720296 RepID=UPI00073F4FD4|nr:YolD-like family protein [Paenibacillus rubinfantis]